MSASCAGEKSAMDWKLVFGILEESAAEDEKLPSVSQIAVDHGRNPFKVLVSTMISLRTKDEVTYRASERLFGEADTPEAVASLTAERIAELIRPAGFYKTKARHIRETAKLITEKHGGKVPSDEDQLLAFPGVGRKTANLVLNLGFGLEAICVDTHVNRIANRLGWVDTKTPEETERALQGVLPRKYWIPVNGLLVAYGKKICTPLSPKCSLCRLSDLCPRRNVSVSR